MSIVFKQMGKYLNISEIINTEEKSVKFEMAIFLLKQLNLDDDTTEVMLHELGIGNRIYGRIVGEEIYNTAEKVWNDFYNNDTLTYNDFNDYFNDKFMHNL